LNSGVFGQISNIKKSKISSEEIASIVSEDITVRQALVTADFTREIYAENCRFQDEIDTYEIEQYIQGTKALFDPSNSHVDLLGSVQADDQQVNFRFSEVLAFNIPFRPTVSLTGSVSFSRNLDTGLIEYSRERWDQGVFGVLKTINFNK